MFGIEACGHVTETYQCECGVDIAKKRGGQYNDRSEYTKIIDYEE